MNLLPEPSNSPPPDLKKWVRYAAAGVLLSCTGATLALRFSHQQVDLTLLTNFPRKGAVFLLGMAATAWICNGLRTWILSRIVGHPIRALKAIGITLSMEFAIAATPAGIGGMVTRLALQKQQGMSFRKSASLMSADWIADLLFFLLLAPFGCWQLSSLLPWQQAQLLPSGLWKLLSTLCCLLLLTFVALCSQRKHIVFCFPARFRQRMRHLRMQILHSCCSYINEVRSTFALILCNHRLEYLAVLGLATLQWICRYGILWVILTLLGSQVNPFVIMLIQGSLFMLGMFLVAPGGGGSVEILTSLILAPMVGVTNAAIAVVIWRCFTYYAYLIAGGLAFACNTRNWGLKYQASEGLISIQKGAHTAPMATSEPQSRGGSI